jgi:hypothetical protein
VSPNPHDLDEPAARRVLLVRAFDAAPDARWVPEDGQWSTRAARETAPPAATAAQLLNERARHAMQRLLGKDATLAPLLAQRLWRPGWGALALLLGLLLGVGMDALGASQSINLLAPPVWGVLLWNGLVYAALLARSLWAILRPATTYARVRRLRAALVRALSGGVGRAAAQGGAVAAFGAQWLRLATPMLLARAAQWLHVAAAALALGLVASLYLRGLVLDYRVGWQSTFLDAAQVHAALAWLMAPASAISGIGVPDTAALQALRTPPGAAPTAAAAPWIHLYATWLLLGVVLPRSLLAAWCAWRAGRQQRRFALPLSELYFQRLLRELRGEAAVVQVLPHGADLAPAAQAGLRRWLAAALGEGVQVQLAPAVAHGGEDDGAAAAAQPAAAGTTLRAMLVELGATPEDEAHGRLLRALRHSAPTVPAVLLADESGFAARFASMPERVAQRRAAWQAWAQAQGAGLACVNLAHPALERAESALQAALRPG